MLSNTQFVTHITFSFIPTAITTLLEPFLVLVGYYLTLYQPYAEVRRGNASPGSSLDLKNTNISPVLIAQHVIRYGHIFHFLPSIIVMTGIFLAVPLGGIFNRGLQSLKSDKMVTYPFTTSINTDFRKVILVETHIL